MERVFFSKENFGIIYNIIQKKIMNANGFDINNKEIFNKELVSVMKAVYQQRCTTFAGTQAAPCTHLQ